MCWWLKQFWLRWHYATREPYDLDGNRALLAEIDHHWLSHDMPLTMTALRDKLAHMSCESDARFSDEEYAGYRCCIEELNEWLDTYDDDKAFGPIIYGREG